MHARRIIVLLVYLLSVLLSVAAAKKYTADKRVQGQSTFKTMMRYGRAGKDGKVHVRPRADAFFLGPRYGKRSSWSPLPPPSAPDEDFSCTYIGISDLYRCTPRKGQSGGDFLTSSD